MLLGDNDDEVRNMRRRFYEYVAIRRGGFRIKYVIGREEQAQQTGESHDRQALAAATISYRDVYAYWT
jgi:hypothetical protein